MWKSFSQASTLPSQKARLPLLYCSKNLGSIWGIAQTRRPYRMIAAISFRIFLQYLKGMHNNHNFSVEICLSTAKRPKNDRLPLDYLDALLLLNIWWPVDSARLWSLWHYFWEGHGKVCFFVPSSCWQTLSMQSFVNLDISISFNDITRRKQWSILWGARLWFWAAEILYWQRVLNSFWLIARSQILSIQQPFCFPPPPLSC